MMTTLWATNSQKRDSTYVDLFKNVPGDLNKKFIEWNSKLSDQPHNFLGQQVKPIKSNTIAAEFGKLGNDYYDRENWRRAIEFYNRGICFAKADSSHLAVLHLKRGFCFSHLKMFDEGANDIEIALSKNFRPDSEPDLRRFIVEWRQSAKDTAQKTQRNIPQLSFDAGNSSPYMANVLDVQQSDDFNTFIVAKSDIDVGQIVLAERSFVSIANGYDRAYCFTCLRTGVNLIPCSQCTDVMFCNDECMDCSEVHKNFCGQTYHRLSTDVKFVVQSILEAIVLFSTVQNLMNFVKNPLNYQRKTDRMFDYALFLSLLSETSSNLPLLLIYKVYTTLMSMTTIKSKFDSETKEKFLMHLVGHHAQVLKNDAFGGFETQQNQFIAATMLNMATLFEHSCTPNLMHFPLDNYEIFITIRQIKAGDHLNYDYWNWDAENTNEDRRDWLQAQGINCVCGKCDDHHSTNQRMCVNPSFFFISNYKKHFGCHASRILKDKCLNFLRKFKYDKWTKEMEIVTKAYTRCLLADYRRTC